LASFLAFFRTLLLILKDFPASIGFVLQNFRIFFSDFRLLFKHVRSRTPRHPCAPIRLSPGWRCAKPSKNLSPAYNSLYILGRKKSIAPKSKAISDRRQGVIVTGRVHGNIGTFAAPSRHEALPRVARFTSKWHVSNLGSPRNPTILGEFVDQQ